MKAQKKDIDIIKAKQLNYIADYILKETNIDVRENTKSRKQPFAEIRFLFFYLAKKSTEYRHVTIGSFLNKDHASVLHGIKVFENQFLIKYCREVDVFFKINKSNDTTALRLINRVYQVQKDNHDLITQNRILKAKGSDMFKSNELLKELFTLGDAKVSEFCETRLKPFLLMNKAKI